MSRQPGGRRGGLFSLIGQGIGVASEYHEHRKQQAQARSASAENQQEETTVPSNTHQDRPREVPTDLPPAYAEAPQGDETSVSLGPSSTSGKRTPSPYQGDSDFDSEHSDLESLEDDDEDWALDDLERDEGITPPESLADRDSLPPSYEEAEATKEHETVDELVQIVMDSAQPGNSARNEDNARPYKPLPCPVILPQRRPRKKARGFIQAYSPVLNDCGIGQETFLSFLKSFHKASQASPIFPAIQLSAAIAGFAPSVIAMAVCTAAQVAAGVGAEIQTRARTNDFLVRMNEELFKPHGLYAMIVKYKSDTELEQSAAGRQGLLSSLIKVENVDTSANHTNQAIAKYVRTASANGSSSLTVIDRMQNLRLASDTTRGAIELPEAAPLIFPDLDHKLQHEGPETFKDQAQDAKNFLTDYMDRRAQMQYAMQNPNSSLSIPENQRAFHSKLADPNHPMYSGGLVSLVSGGTVNPRQMKHERKLAKFEAKRERRMEKDVRRFERGKESKKEGKRARRYGEDYVEELHARTGRRGRGSGGLIGSIAGLAQERLQGSQSSANTQPSSYAERNEEYDPSTQGSTRSFDSHGSGAYGQDSSRAAAYTRRRAGRRGGGGAIGTVKRIMREDVLYLTIVNMPSEAELEEARQELEMAKRA